MPKANTAIFGFYHQKIGPVVQKATWQVDTELTRWRYFLIAGVTALLRYTFSDSEASAWFRMAALFESGGSVDIIYGCMWWAMPIRPAIVVIQSHPHHRS
jgi:hypothetical protein